MGSSNPQNLTNVNGTLYFVAYDNNVGSELWKSDGTEAGTVLVKDIFSGIGSSNLQNLTNVNGTLYFSATDGNGGNELWKSDGTEAGTVLVKDIFSGIGSSYPNNITYINGKLYFFADNGNTGQELFVLDLNSTPTDLSLSTSSVNENVPSNTLIGNLSTNDPDTENTHTYTLVSGTGDTDNNAFTIVDNELHINISPDYETKNSYNIRLRATDGGGLFYEKAIAIAVNNINDAPTLANSILDQTAIKDTTFNFTLPTNTFADVDAGDNLTYSATLENGGPIPCWLTFDGITFSGTPTNNDVGSLNIKVIASDETTTVSDVFALAVLNTSDGLFCVGDSITTKELDADTQSDTLITGSGNTNLFSDVSNDVLIGGSKQASFDDSDIYTGVNSIITDLNIENDTVYISQPEFILSRPENTSLESSLFQLGTSRITASDRFIYNQTTDSIFDNFYGITSTVQIGH